MSRAHPGLWLHATTVLRNWLQTNYSSGTFWSRVNYNLERLTPSKPSLKFQLSVKINRGEEGCSSHII